jgi:DNA-binding transcriptional ArsR family regulator
MATNTKVKIDTKTGEQLLLNSGFSQIYDSWWRVQRVLVDEYPTALKVVSWLIEMSDKENAIIASYSAIASAINKTPRTVISAINYLKEKNIVKILKSGGSNVYILNDQIVWKDTASKKDKCSQFSAKVYIVASEQEEIFKTKLIGHAVKKITKKMAVKLSESFA